MNLTIRRATADDAAEAWATRNVAIRHACKGFYADHLLERWTAGEMTGEFVEHVVQRFYMATLDGAVAGFGSVDLGAGCLEGLFVRPEMMGKGRITASSWNKLASPDRIECRVASLQSLP